MTATVAGKPNIPPLWRGLAAVACSAMAVVLSTPAHAANDSVPLLELSSDGVHFEQERPLPVFASTKGYVPGEARSGVVWVRNASSQPSQFSLAVTNTGSGQDSAMANYLQLAAVTPGWNATAGIPVGAGDCTALVEDWKIPAGESLRIDLELGFQLTAPNSTRHQESNAEVLFLLQDHDGGVPVSPCAPTTAIAAASMGRVTINSSTEQNQALAAIAELPEVQAETQQDFLRQQVQGPQSNVVATSRSPWPWLLILSAVAYMGISLRRQKRTQ